MLVCTLASGSRGNSAVVSCGDTHILLDAGISTLRIKRGLAQLGLTPSDLSAVLITHAHHDHIGGLTTLTKQVEVPIYATCGTEPTLREKAPMMGRNFHPVLAGEVFFVGEAEIFPFATPHDAMGSVGYRITSGGCSMALATDLGHLTDTVLDGVRGVDLLVAELNHDEDWVRTSDYPYPLQQRILGDYGHLSNEAGAELLVRAVRSGTKAVLLAHLSPENNTPAHALSVAQCRLRAEGFDLENEVHIEVAPAKELGSQFEISDGAVAVRRREAVAIC